MQCYTELIPPTAVTHATAFPFLTSTSRNIVVAKHSLLQIFSIRSPSSLVQADQSSECKLVLEAQYDLAGTVTALQHVKLPNSKSGGEALLVATKNARLSLVEWDPSSYAISTISIHLYEREDFRGGPCATDMIYSENSLIVDPSSRCAALVFASSYLAVLPFRQGGDDLIMDDYDSGLDGMDNEEAPSQTLETEGTNTFHTPYSSSFVVPLVQLDPRLVHTIHLAFLHEYREPTFGILYTHHNPSSALLEERKDPLNYSVLGLDPEERAVTTLLSINKLPYDLHTVRPLPMPIGGTLLIGCNEIIHVDQAGKTVGVAVNEAARLCTSFPLADRSELKLKLEDCIMEQLDLENGDMLLLLPDGRSAVLKLEMDGRSVSGLQIRLTAEIDGVKSFGSASCAANVAKGLLFVGGRNCESSLVQWNRNDAMVKRKKSRVDLGQLQLGDEEEEEDYEDDLYSGNAEGTNRPRRLSSSGAPTQGDYTFHVLDQLLNLAPLGNMTFGRSQHATIDYVAGAHSQTSLELFTTTGRGTDAGLHVLKRMVDPVVIHQYAKENVRGVWTVSVRDRSVAKPQAGETDAYHPFMIMSKTTATGEGESILCSPEASKDFQEIQGTDFDRSGATIDVGCVAGGTRVVQVLDGEVRSYDSGKHSTFSLPLRPETFHLRGSEPGNLPYDACYVYGCVTAWLYLLSCTDNGVGQSEGAVIGDLLGPRKRNGSRVSATSTNHVRIAILSIDFSLGSWSLDPIEQCNIILAVRTFIKCL